MTGLIMGRSFPIMMSTVRPMLPTLWNGWHSHKFLWRRRCMPEVSSYDYAIIRIVPYVERGECMNAGVILFCRTRRFLGMLLHVEQQRLSSFAPQLDFSAVQQQ